MPQGYRPDRVADQLRAELGELLAREVHDPGVGFVTLTRVQLTPDLQLARVYYTALGDAARRRATARALERATPFLRHQIGRRLRLRRVPEIEFVFDEGVGRQERVEQLLQEWHRQTDARPPERGAAGEPAGPADHDDHRPPEE
jgi:ribosome-binding factor A